MRELEFRRTTLIALGLVAFLAGLGLARLKLYVPVWWTGMVLGFLIFSCYWLRKFIPLAIVLVGIFFGLFRGGSYLQQVDRYAAFYKQPVTITGVANTDAVYGDRSQLTFDLGHLRLTSPADTNLVGKIGVKGFGEYMVYKGDKVQVSGKLYPTRGAKSASISFADIKTLERSNSVIESTRRRFEAGMQSALPEPLASFGLGLLIGQRTTIPKDVNAQLAAVGLTHIVAVSGYNLTIIMRAVRHLLKKRSKYQSTLVSILLIGLFLLFTGFSASIVRAALVSTLSLWAWYYGRNFRPLVLILLAAALTAGWYPIYLWSDIGWWLSFLAFYGVLVLGPLLARRLFHLKEPKLVAAVAIETVSAQIMTLPLIMYIFGQLSVVSLVANMLVVPLVSVGMLLCLFAGLGGMLLAPVSGWFAWPARYLLTYMLDVAAILARLPGALVEQPLLLWQMLALYLLVLVVVVILWQKNRGSRGILEIGNGV